MSKRRVIAYFMHDDEKAFAEARMPDAQATESFLVGDVEEGDIPSLEEHGLVVDQQVSGGAITEAAAEEETRLRRRFARRSTMRADIDAEGEEAEVAHEEAAIAGAPEEEEADMEGDGGGGAGAGAAAAPEAPRPAGRARAATSRGRGARGQYILRLKGPLLDEWRQRLQRLGVQPRERLARIGGYRMKLSLAQARRVSALPFVESLRLLEAEAPDSEPVRRAAPAPPPPASGVKAMLTYDILLEAPDAKPPVMRWLEKRHIAIGGSSDRKIRVYMLEGSDLADQLKELEGVEYLELYVPPKLTNDRARILLGVDVQSGAGLAATLIQDGDGQIVAVADTGLDIAHPDIPPDRVIDCVALGRSGDASDPDGHGTHVAGSVLGDGSASNRQVRGVAPGAKLYFQSIMDSRGDLGGLPLELGDLLGPAYEAGARIHNNSWGAETASAYTMNAREVDEFVAAHRDMLVVFAAGNAGSAKNAQLSDPGFVDWSSLDSPATSKNALTVGASRSDRAANGYSALTYGALWPDRYPDAPIAAELVSGNPECLAGFSSRGPCNDYRIKPDVVCPGTDIVSTRSSAAPLRNFWGSFPGNGRYAINGGTSMAAPLVAGCAALIREYYVKSRNHQPSAALVKATLINSTTWLTGADSLADYAKLPNFHQGFGRVNMRFAIPNAKEPGLFLQFFDNWQDEATHLVRTGQAVKLQFEVEAGRELRICLGFTDHPVGGLQNNLSVTLQKQGQSKKWMGNEDLPMKITTTDTVNNVEVIRLPEPAAGVYTVQVFAQSLLYPGQDFALVITGKNVSDLLEV